MLGQAVGLSLGGAFMPCVNRSLGASPRVTGRGLGNAPRAEGELTQVYAQLAGLLGERSARRKRRACNRWSRGPGGSPRRRWRAPERRRLVYIGFGVTVLVMVWAMHWQYWLKLSFGVGLGDGFGGGVGRGVHRPPFLWARCRGRRGSCHTQICLARKEQLTKFAGVGLRTERATCPGTLC